MLDVSRTYLSVGAADFSGWSTNLSPRALFNRPGSVTIPVQSISFVGDDQQTLTFTRNSGTQPWLLVGELDNKEVLSVDSLQTPLDVRLRRSGQIQFYDRFGRITQRLFSDGRSLFYSYLVDPISLQINELVVSDQWGRVLRVSKDPWTQRLKTVTLPGGGTIKYEHDSPLQRLTAAEYPDGSKRIYHYNEAALTSGINRPFALTGISEQGVSQVATRVSTSSYDALGRATTTERASGVDRYSISYPASYSQATIVDPLGSARTLALATLLGAARVATQSQPAGSGCGPHLQRSPTTRKPTSLRAPTSTTTRSVMRTT